MTVTTLDALRLATAARQPWQWVARCDAHGRHWFLYFWGSPLAHVRRISGRWRGELVHDPHLWRAGPDLRLVARAIWAVARESRIKVRDLSPTQRRRLRSLLDDVRARVESADRRITLGTWNDAFFGGGIDVFLTGYGSLADLRQIARATKSETALEAALVGERCGTS